MKNLSVQAAIDYLDGTLIRELPITRVDGPTRTFAVQLLKDERIFAATQGMLAKMVWQPFQEGNT